tara:strand:- start:2619 stop:3002 length:384 start_codon:yes stop_codon:yes gene_type:complete
MQLHDITTSAQIKALAACIETAEKQGFIMDSYIDAGFNKNSGFVYVGGEDWDLGMYVGVKLSEFQGGSETMVETIMSKKPMFLLSCPYSGEEFFGSVPESCILQYKAYAKDAIADGDMDEDELLMPL